MGLRELVVLLLLAASGISHADIVYRSVAEMTLGPYEMGRIYDGVGDLTSAGSGLIDLSVPPVSGSDITTFAGRGSFEFLRGPIGSNFFGFLSIGDIVGPQPSFGSGWPSPPLKTLVFEYLWSLFGDDHYSGISDSVGEAWVGFRLSQGEEMFYGILHLDFYFPDVQHPGEEIAGHVQIVGAYLETSPDEPLMIGDGFVVVPEPGSMGLIVAGVGVLLSLGAMRRRN